MGDAMRLHPGVVIALKRLDADELGVARLMAAGELPSPQRYENVTLFALRITGTGLSYRTAHDEHVWRNPDLYCNAEFLARCNGLPVVWEHPERAVLDTKEFGNRVVGTIFLPYVEGAEVWGIAKIFDEDAARLMTEGQLSTSPGVVFRDASVNDRLQSDDGRTLLLEGKPSLLDHLAICELGVWDKGGDPAGVRKDSEKDRIMTKRADGMEEEMAAEGEGSKEGQKLDKVLAHLDAMSKRMDAQDKRFDALEAKKDADCDPEEPKPRMTKADMDGNAMADVQSRADGVYGQFGKRAAAPMAGETILAYRLRVLRDLKEFSPEFKDADLRLVARADAVAFGAIEAKIYADAVEAAKNPAGPEEYGFLERVKVDPFTGQRTKEFFARKSIFNQMALKPMYLTGLLDGRTYS